SLIHWVHWVTESRCQVQVTESWITLQVTDPGSGSLSAVTDPRWGHTVTDHVAVQSLITDRGHDH
ncbi:hypothetical protein HPP92_017068, partial [Vanilla planifolia]